MRLEHIIENLQMGKVLPGVYGLFRVFGTNGLLGKIACLTCHSTIPKLLTEL